MQKQVLGTVWQALYLNDQLKSFTDVCGACKSIRNTPVAFLYSIFFMAILFSLVFHLRYLTIPIVALIFYVISSIGQITYEIENAFEDVANDLILGRISDNNNMHMIEFLKNIRNFYLPDIFKSLILL